MADSSSPKSAAPAGPSVLTYLRLFRLPNVFTAIADVAMGFLVAGGTKQPLGPFITLACASALLYTAGMILNDLFDLEIDRRERPSRPLPAGLIPLAQARALGYLMLILGVALGALSGFAYATQAAVPWRGAVVAALLAVAILLYNGGLKRTPFGPIGMGLCRFLNVLLGMSFAADDPAGLMHYGWLHLLPALGIGLYIAGVTWFAQDEAEASSPQKLSFSLAVMTAGIFVVGLTTLYVAQPYLQPKLFVALLVCLWLSVGRRALAAIMQPSPQTVQAAIKHSIMSLIMFDASVCLLVAPAEFGVAVVALLIPAIFLGRWVYST